MCCCHSPIHSLGSLANIKSHQPPILACCPSSLTQLHVWNGNITAHRLSEKKRGPPPPQSLAMSARCSAVKFEIHAWTLSSFLKPFFFFFSMRPLCNLFSLRVVWLSFPLIPHNLCLAGVVRLGGNGFSGYHDGGGGGEIGSIHISFGFRLADMPLALHYAGLWCI